MTELKLTKLVELVKQEKEKEKEKEAAVRGQIFMPVVA